MTDADEAPPGHQRSPTCYDRPSTSASAGIPGTSHVIEQAKVPVSAMTVQLRVQLLTWPR